MAEAIVIEHPGKVEVTIFDLTEGKRWPTRAWHLPSTSGNKVGVFPAWGGGDGLARLMDEEVGNQIGTGLRQRSGGQQAEHKGYRECILHTRQVTLELPIPKLHSGSFFHAFLESRRLTAQEIAAVIQEARIGEVSARSTTWCRPRG